MHEVTNFYLLLKATFFQSNASANRVKEWLANVTERIKLLILISKKKKKTWLRRERKKKQISEMLAFFIIGLCLTFAKCQNIGKLILLGEFLFTARYGGGEYIGVIRVQIISLISIHCHVHE